MSMPGLIAKFLRCESGAVTVDWVVLTAAIVGLGFAIMVTVSGGLRTAATSISADIAAKAVAFE